MQQIAIDRFFGSPVRCRIGTGAICLAVHIAKNPRTVSAAGDMAARQNATLAAGAQLRVTRNCRSGVPVTLPAERAYTRIRQNIGIREEETARFRSDFPLVYSRGTVCVSDSGDRALYLTHMMPRCPVCGNWAGSRQEPTVGRSGNGTVLERGCRGQAGQSALCSGRRRDVHA